MKNSRHSIPQINAGSTADIAFLMLIFFLVTAVIPKDEGFLRQLPEPCPPGEKCHSEVKKRNMLEVRVNSKNELFVNNKIIAIEDLKEVTIDFIDNNGNATCDYCQGEALLSASEHPQKAVISLMNDKGTSYEFYIKIQDELTKAYYELRSRYAENTFKKSVSKLSNSEIEAVKKAYPFKLSEAELK